MKKRKQPILLVTGLILCVCVAIGFNYAATASQAPPSQQQPEAPKVNGSTLDPKRAPNNTPNSVAQQAKMQMGGGHGGPGGSGGPGGHPGMPGRPMLAPGKASIAVQKAANPRPTPNDSATSTQWYTPESGKSGQ